MKSLDLKVIEQALEWVKTEHRIWLCTVLATFGSSPREPGSLLVARADGAHCGSLSGGCVEEDFLERIVQGEFKQPISVVRYGDTESPTRVSLPCGGVLEVLVERLLSSPDTLAHLDMLHSALLGQHSRIRRVDLTHGDVRLLDAPGPGPRVERTDTAVHIRLGPLLRLVIAGISPVSRACAEFALTLGFEVIVCDPRKDACETFDVPGARVEAILPSLFITAGGCHGATAVVALTHDPRIDDLAMIEAVRTPAFYIGVMGSAKTSRQRAERLQRSGGLSPEEIARLHMPIGLNLGSKTPAEIALAVVADILRVQRGKTRDEL